MPSSNDLVGREAPNVFAPRMLLASCGLGWLALTSILVGLGSSSRDSALLAVGIVVQWVAGTILWSASRQRDVSLVEALGAGLVLGTVLSVLAGVAGNLVVLWSWWWITPVLVAAFVWLRYRDRPDRLRVTVDSAATLWPVVVGLLGGLAVLWLNLRQYPLSWLGLWDGYHPDMVFFEALSHSVADFGADDSIFMVGGDIRYHWLTYAWSGQLSSAFDAAPFMVLTRVLPLVALLCLVLLAVAMVNLIARNESSDSRTWARWLAVALVISGGYVGAVNGTILNFDSPSQSLTSAWVLAWTVMVVRVATTSQRDPTPWLLLALVAFAVTGGKVSAGFVVGVGVGFAALVGVLSRRSWRQAVMFAALLTGAAVGLAGLYFAWGSASPGDLRFLDWENRASTVQGLDSSTGRRGAALGTAGFLLAIAARWSGGVFLLAVRQWRARVEPWLWVGFFLAGALPVILFAQGVNETWFALTASAPLAVLSAVGLAVAWQRAGLGIGAAISAVASGLIGFLAVSYVWTDQVWESGFGRFWGPWLGYAVAAAAGLALVMWRRQHAVWTFFAVAALVLTVEATLGRGTPIVAALAGGARDDSGVRASQLANPGLVGTSELSGAVRTETRVPSQAKTVLNQRPLHAWSSEHQAAGDFLRAHAGRRDVVVTNEVDAYLVPALSRRQTFISGAPYQALYGSAFTAELIPARLESNQAFLEQTDPSVLAQVCRSGARWIWLANDRSPTGDVDVLGMTVFSNESVSIVRLDPDSCTR